MTSLAEMQRFPAIRAAVTGRSWQQPRLVQSLKVVPGDFQWRPSLLTAAPWHVSITCIAVNVVIHSSVRGLGADSRISDANLLALMVFTCQHPLHTITTAGRGVGEDSNCNSKQTAPSQMFATSNQRQSESRFRRDGMREGGKGRIRAIHARNH